MYTGPFGLGDIIGGHGRTILAIQWVGFLITATLVILRWIYPGPSSQKRAWDFIWIILALLFMTALNILSIFAISNGLGNHQWVFTSYDYIVNVAFWLTWATGFGLLGITFAKFSVIALLLNGLESHLPSRIILWLTAVVVAIMNVFTFLMLVFQCRPVSRAWDLLADGICDHRDAVLMVTYVNAGISGVTDLLLALWPIYIVWRMTMTMRSKVIFSTFMIIMSLSCIPAFVRCFIMKEIVTDTDATYTLGVLYVCASAEAWAVTILPSIVKLRPVWHQVGRKTGSLLPQTVSRNQSQPHDDLPTGATYGNSASAGTARTLESVDGPKDSITTESKDLVMVQRITIKP